jgi:predicted RecB family nuclease
LNPMIEARSRPGLAAQGFSTLTELAEGTAAEINDVLYLAGEDKKRRAILQARSLKTGEIFATGDIHLPDGICVHFDVETDPIARDGAGQVYLWGLLEPPYDEAAFHDIWKTDGDDDDLVAWQAFLDRINAYRYRFKDALLLVHYSDYEITKIKQYAVRYGMQENPTVVWLLSDEGPLVDLMKIVKANLILPVYSYSLKAICKDHRLVDFQWQQEGSGSQWSVVRYYDYLAAEDPADAESIKKEILAYNFDDVRATAALWDWVGRFAG